MKDTEIDESFFQLIEIPKALQSLEKETARKIYNDMAYGGTSSMDDISLIKEFVQSPFEGKENEVYTCFKAAIYIINFFSSEDPSKLHYQVSREVLREYGGDALESQEKIRDLLARELVGECRNFASKIIPSPLLQEKANDKTLFVLKKECGEPFEHLTTAVSDKLWIDNVFLEHLTSIGKNGYDLAKKLSVASKRWLEEYLIFGQTLKLFRLWIDLEEQPYFCRYLKVFAEIVWKDRVQSIWEKQSKHVPAITKGVLITTIKPPLSKNCKVEVSETKITCYSEEGKSIAIVPCVDPKLVNLICRGMEGFSSLTGHKLFRWQVRTGFENWANNSEDPRLICTKGGYEGIANLIGCSNSKKSPTEVKAILYAQAHAHFQFPHGGSGNMIILREMDKLRNGEPTNINIILGELLFPNFTHMLPQGEKKRLVPITELPPLIGSKNTHAAQAMLQLLILEEFSDKSDALFKKRSIRITLDRWEQLAKESKLPRTSLSRVIAGWVEGDLFSKPFLDKQGDEYTLGPAYENVINFLEYQGKQRVSGAKGGERSAAIKKKMASENYSRKKKKNVNPP